jgi:hypothetical protein
MLTNFDGPTNDLPSYADLLASKALTVGDRVFYSERKGERFYDDLLPDGRIRYSAGQTPSLDDVYFLSPTVFHNFCGRRPQLPQGKRIRLHFLQAQRGQDVGAPVHYPPWREAAVAGFDKAVDEATEDGLLRQTYNPRQLDCERERETVKVRV